MRPTTPGRSGERGIALFVVILLLIVVSASLLTATMLATNGGIIQRNSERAKALDDASIAGLDEALSRVNATRTLYPSSGYTTLENGVAVTTASGATIPGLTRSTYVGPAGISSGQYGVTGSVVSVTRDARGNQTVRRLEINQESFAKYAYFTDDEGDNIWFGGGDQIFGPVHSNDRIQIHSTGATFWDEVQTARQVLYPNEGRFMRGYRENVSDIPMPTTADLADLSAQATAGGTRFTATSNAARTAGNEGEATVRIEFVTRDLNDDGDGTDPDEGFFRVYRASDGWNRGPSYVVASNVPPTLGNSDSLLDSRNCGRTNPVTGVVDEVLHEIAGANNNARAYNRRTAVNNAPANRPVRCYLGGDPALSGGVFTPTTVRPDRTVGAWVPWTGPIDARLAARFPQDAGFLFPLSRLLNPNFKGVIYVDSKVAVSGVVRGKVTVASPLNIIIADDLRQATDPGSENAANCDDIIGLFSAQEIVVANNTINSPQRTRERNDPDDWDNWRTLDDSSQEFLQAVILALQSFRAQDHDQGAADVEDCGANDAGRGCLLLTGGVIQDTRGAVGIIGGTGYIKRYSYNGCAATSPPPYFPTTGKFVRNRVYELDPTGFDVDTWFANYQH
jgi:hypothetical protein